MKILPLTSLALSIALFTCIGAGTLNASNNKCGASKCGSKKTVSSKCGSDKNASKYGSKKSVVPAGKCSQGKCG